MSQRKLRDDIRHHYLEKKLPAETLARLTAMAETVEERRRPVPKTAPRTIALAVAAMLTLALGLSLLWPAFDDHPTARHQLASAVAEEIAMNHNKGLALEFPTESFTELDRQMDKLDFTLVDPNPLKSQGYRLLGGRYCSIQGHLAAQLSMESPTGVPVTLYQTPLVDELTDLSATDLRARGLRIELWHEEGVFLGLARAP